MINNYISPTLYQTTGNVSSKNSVNYVDGPVGRPDVALHDLGHTLGGGDGDHALGVHLDLDLLAVEVLHDDAADGEVEEADLLVEDVRLEHAEEGLGVGGQGLHRRLVELREKWRLR